MMAHSKTGVSRNLSYEWHRIQILLLFIGVATVFDKPDVDCLSMGALTDGTHYTKLPRESLTLILLRFLVSIYII